MCPMVFMIQPIVGIHKQYVYIHIMLIFCWSLAKTYSHIYLRGTEGVFDTLAIFDHNIFLTKVWWHRRFPGWWRVLCPGEFDGTKQVDPTRYGSLHRLTGIGSKRNKIMELHGFSMLFSPSWSCWFQQKLWKMQGMNVWMYVDFSWVATNLSIMWERIDTSEMIWIQIWMWEHRVITESPRQSIDTFNGEQWTWRNILQGTPRLWGSWNNACSLQTTTCWCRAGNQAMIVFVEVVFKIRKYVILIPS